MSILCRHYSMTCQYYVASAPWLVSTYPCVFRDDITQWASRHWQRTNDLVKWHLLPVLQWTFARVACWLHERLFTCTAQDVLRSFEHKHAAVIGLTTSRVYRTTSVLFHLRYPTKFIRVCSAIATCQRTSGKRRQGQNKMATCLLAPGIHFSYR